MNISDINILDKLFEYNCVEFIDNDVQCIKIYPLKIMRIFKCCLLKNIIDNKLQLRPMNSIIDGNIYTLVLKELIIDINLQQIDNLEKLIDVNDNYMEIFQYFKIRKYKYKK